MNRTRPERPGWDQYFLEMAKLASTRTSCLRRAVGAVLVSDRRVVATGYNGAPRGAAHCRDAGCVREQLGVPSGERQELCRGLHAEQNAIIQAALHGISTRGTTLYCTTMPCAICAKMIVNAGIVRIVYADGYNDLLARGILEEGGVAIEKPPEATAGP